MGIRYTDRLDGITPGRLNGFFDGWPEPPSPEEHLKLLHGSWKVFLAVDDSSGNVVGFVNAISDGVLSAYIPLLEVLPAFRHKGIGTQLIERMLESLSSFRTVDLMCDEQLQAFYERFSMRRANGMIIRRCP